MKPIKALKVNYYDNKCHFMIKRTITDKN